MTKRQRKKLDKKICKTVALVRSSMIQKERKSFGKDLYTYLKKAWVNDSLSEKDVQKFFDKLEPELIKNNPAIINITPGKNEND